MYIRLAVHICVMGNYFPVLIFFCNLNYYCNSFIISIGYVSLLLDTLKYFKMVMNVYVPKVYGGEVSWLGGVIVKVAHLVVKCIWFSITTLVMRCCKSIVVGYTLGWSS